jgi:hypothetical protein
MNVFSEQLLKAGLVSAEQAEKAAREVQQPAPPPRPPRGGDASRRDGGERSEARGDRRDGPRRDGGGERRDGGGERRDGGGERRGRGGAGQGGPTGSVSAPLEALKARDAEALGIARAGKVDGKTAGHRRWYWQARGAGLPFMEVSEDAHGRLERGELAIVESPRGDAWLISGEAAAKLRAVDPTWLRVWNGRA